MKTKYYPLTFTPVLKEKIWGGNKLHKLFDKGDSAEVKLGESWEIADLTEGQSVVNNGALKDLTFREVIDQDPEALMGEPVYKRFGKQFPLLIKFIDAAGDLSIQVHPDDTNSPTGRGKTEMWYIMQADKGAKLTVGFNQKSSRKEFANHIKNHTVEDVMHTHLVQPGDAFFIKAGRIHAIGAGVLLAEIQQTSDVTYRVYDYNRKDDSGKLRDLHIEESLAVLDYETTQDFKLNYDKNTSGAQVLKHHTYFKTDWVQVDKNNYWIDRADSFTIIIVVSGNITYVFENTVYNLSAGQTVLIPAACTAVEIKKSSGKFLEVYL